MIQGQYIFFFFLNTQKEVMSLTLSLVQILKLNKWDSQQYNMNASYNHMAKE